MRHASRRVRDALADRTQTKMRPIVRLSDQNACVSGDASNTCVSYVQNAHAGGNGRGVESSKIVAQVSALDVAADTFRVTAIANGYIEERSRCATSSNHVREA